MPLQQKFTNNICHEILLELKQKPPPVVWHQAFFYNLQSN